MSNLNLSLYHDAGFSTTQMRLLEQLLEVNSPHWIKLNPDTGIYELVLDNQMLSTYRQCPAHFIESYVNGYVLKGDGTRSWFLEFGILFHQMIEEYYNEFRNPSFNVQDWGIKHAVAKWADANMDFHQEHKEYKSIGGVQGFCGMLLAYAMNFGAFNERFRVIGTEISFGKAKEVTLGHIFNPNSIAYLSCYLSGRIDVLVDDGNSICPMDHKTMASFRFDPTMRYEMDEGPTGYIYAVNQILPSFLTAQGLDNALLKRSCNKIIMNYISKAIPKEGERFKRSPIMKTSEQLESYRLRMLTTVEKLFRDLVRYASGNEVDRDTSKCNNWYMHDCTFLGPHRQNSKQNEQVFFQTFFEKKEIWDTEDV